MEAYNMKIGFIGAGAMASAIIERLNKTAVYIYDRLPEKRTYFKNLGYNICEDYINIIHLSDIIILAVKPQDMSELLTNISDCIDESKIIVSIAAGISINYIKSKLGNNKKIVRVMPNTPLLFGYGATAISCGESDDESLNIIQALFSKMGLVEIIPEEKMNSIIAVNGSSPAFCYLFAKAIADGASEQGISYEAALNLFCKTMEGTAVMLARSDKRPDDLIKQVASPGGTTLAALEVLNSQNFTQIIKNAMFACTKRADELSEKLI